MGRKEKKVAKGHRRVMWHPQYRRRQPQVQWNRRREEGRQPQQ